MAKTYKQIEESRNRRLWVTGVILPTATLTGTVFVSLYNGNPDFKLWVNQKMWNTKMWFNRKFHKK